MKLYYSRNLNPRLAVAVAKHLHSPVEFVPAQPRHPAHEDAFRAINPNTLVPVLVDGGDRLWETDAIACKLSRVAQSDFFCEGEHLIELMRWLSWSAYHFMPACGTFYFEHIVRPTFMTRPADEAALAHASDDFHRFAPVLESFLSDRTWLIDGRLTYADFRVAAALPFAQKAQLPLQPYPHICAWHDRLMQLESWRDPFQGLAL
jgi:glutathione S-transferase